MTIESKSSADVVVDAALVRALLHAQHPDLAGLPLADTAEGWDNHLFRLGDALAVRLPRRALAANLIVHEQRWLPLLAARLPLPIPVPVRTGHPGCGFPWSWSVVPWLDGTSAAVVPLPDPAANAVDLGQFLRALHQPAPAEHGRSAAARRADGAVLPNCGAARRGSRASPGVRLQSGEPCVLSCDGVARARGPRTSRFRPLP